MTLKIPPAIAAIAPDGNLTLRQKRRFFIDLVKRRVQPGTGSGIEFLRTRTADHEWPDLREILKGIAWVVVGSVATRAYMPELVTNDFDILIRHRDTRRVETKLRAAGYRKISGGSAHAIRYETGEGRIIHIIPSREHWLNDALANPAHDTAQYPIIPLSYLVLLKLTTNKMQAWADVSRMVAQAPDAIRAEIRDVIAQYSPEDLHDLEALTLLGEKEFEMPANQKISMPKRKRKIKK